MKIGTWMEQLTGKSETEAYSATFFGIRPEDTKESLAERLKKVKEMGFCSVIGGYGTGKMEECRFNETFYKTLDQMVLACREEEMTFWLQDYAPFPTGSADGAYREKEYEKLNKIFVDERHIDISGPLPGAVIRIEDLQRVVYGNAAHTFHKTNPYGRERIGIVACRMKENPASATAPEIEEDTALLLDGQVRDGFLKWDVPEGYWRIFVLFTTDESSGRPYFMNLLSRESMALEIERVHKPVYEHLKEELGKTWNGFFYDEPEIGNNGGADIFDFFMLPGRRTRDKADCSVYPWSPEMPKEMEKREENWILKLPCLWYDAAGDHSEIRYSYMDAVSTLVREHYNGQVYAFCKEKGIHYIGHVLEDENSHDRLGCGPGHYFRQQYYQDEAGIDVIAGQILPGMDKAMSWYGVVNSDGEFYHYGIAKLASSEAHINPIKKNASVCETFAMYGQEGFKDRKFVVDHLLVNGINRLLLCDLPEWEGAGAYMKELVDYTDRMCALLRNTNPIIQTAILYHAEAEWGEGEEAQFFQKPASCLARNQISYDILPTDVFAFPERYKTQTSSGLTVNGNCYKALVIPACDYLPTAVAEFVMEAVKQDYPVLFVDRVPLHLIGAREKEKAEAVWKKFLGNYQEKFATVSLNMLAEKVRMRICPDILVESMQQKWIRYAHVRGEAGECYLLHNESPTGFAECVVTVMAEGEVAVIDPVSQTVVLPMQEQLENGRVRLSLSLERYEMKLLLVSQSRFLFSEAVSLEREEVLESEWSIELPDGKSIKALSGKGKDMPDLAETLGYGFYGKVVYRTSCCFGKELPVFLKLGNLSDCCEVELNGKRLGKRIGTPYLYDVRGAVKEGENELTVELYTSAVNAAEPKSIFGIPLNTLNSVPYHVMEPMGLQGETVWCYQSLR